MTTTNFCPWADVYVAWLRTPLGVMLIAATCSLLCGLFLAPQGYAIFAAIVSVMLLGFAWPWIAMRAISCRVVFVGRRGRENRPAQAKLIVTNRWPWPVWGLAVENPLDADQPDAAVTLARINGWSRSTFDCSFVPTLRGSFPRQEVSIGTGFPFGIYQASSVVTVPRKLIVWPESFWLPPLEVGAPYRHWSGVLSDRLTGTTGIRHGVRPYRPGDELRDVHWAKTARHDEVIVSEREACTVQRLAVIVDTDPSRHAGVGGESTLEWSLRIAASICESVTTQQCGVELWLGDELIVAEGVNAHEKLLDAIAMYDAREATQSGSPTPQTNRISSSNAITICPNTSPVRADRAIVLHTAGFDDRRDNSTATATGWIDIVSPEDIPGQMLRGWRLGFRGVGVRGGGHQGSNRQRVSVDGLDSEESRQGVRHVK
ncbi:MAG: DUF58 domain-containing protein [Planctomycetota bacterium]